MLEVLVLLKQRSTRSGTAVACLGDSHVSVAHGLDSDTPGTNRKSAALNNVILHPPKNELKEAQNNS